MPVSRYLKPHTVRSMPDQQPLHIHIVSVSSSLPVSRYLKLCHTREELARLSQGPKLVMATLPSLQAGMARDLFVEWAADPKNLILFTQQAEVHFLAAVNMLCFVRDLSQQ